MDDCRCWVPVCQRPCEECHVTKHHRVKIEPVVKSKRGMSKSISELSKTNVPQPWLLCFDWSLSGCLCVCHLHLLNYCTLIPALQPALMFPIVTHHVFHPSVPWSILLLLLLLLLVLLIWLYQEALEIVSNQ